jgi:hypothetical protein
MDWGTHVVLAAKLLKSCGLDTGAAIYSVIPVIDKEPAHFHRVYAHILENQPSMLDAALEVFGSREIRERNMDALKASTKKKIDDMNKKIAKLPPVADEERRSMEKLAYAYDRITAEAPAFLKHAEDARELVGDPKVSVISKDKMSAGVSLISHTFFDTWNNPVQVFLPFSSLCSAQWAFWDNIDYLRFRGDFYKPTAIVPFRREIAANPIWNTKLKPEAIIKATIIRLGEMGKPAIPYEVIDVGIRNFMRYMDINEYQRVDNEITFLRQLEEIVTSTITREFRLKAKTG